MSDEFESKARMKDIVVFEAARILTMNPAQPLATHVAVAKGRVLAVGNLERMKAYGPFTVDRRFVDCVLMPGLVEGHSHLMAGGLWKFPYCGFHARNDPNGRSWEGCQSFDAVIERLQEIERSLGDDDNPLLAWGFDPIFFGSERMTTLHLDRISTSRAVIILHASQHLMNVNSAALLRAGIDRHTEVEGIARTPEGEPSGELQEFAAMFPIMRLIGNIFRTTGSSEESLRMFGRLAQRAGVTTATDLVNDLSDENVEVLGRVTAEADFPVRLVPAFLSFEGSLDATASAKRVRARMALNTEKLVYGAVKIVVDGSIQGFTARLRWPGYFNGAPNGIWIRSPDELKAMMAFFHAEGFQLHIHTNGDEAVDVALDGIAAALAAHPRHDHRHTLQHCQMADDAQFRRMAALGVGVNLFANHIFYWGDAHYEQTMGPDRAERINACATALRHGVPLAIHSDAPITPLGPLFTAWCAVNRMTSQGRVLGAAQCISVDEALVAITLGAAFSLGMDHLIGSIEVGKFADFCVLKSDPTACGADKLDDIAIVATVLGGRVMTHADSAS
jgi:predicted amidohydrolase YtcJ